MGLDLFPAGDEYASMGQRDPSQLSNRDVIRMAQERGLLDELSNTVFDQLLSSDELVEQEVIPELQTITEEQETQTRLLRTLIEGSDGAGGSDPTLGDQGFRLNGRRVRIPRVITDEQDVKATNQQYINGVYTTVDSTLDPGEAKEFARVEPRESQVFLFKHTAATAHDTVRYEYFIDDDEDPDEDLTGNIPWATPPDRYPVSPSGYRLVDDFASIRLLEQSGTNSYTNVQASLTGLLLEV